MFTPFESLIVKTLLFSFAAFVLVKIAKTLFDDFLKQKFTHKGHKEKDFDLLIEEKKQMLRKQGLAGTSSKNQNDGNEKKTQNKNLELYLDKSEILNFFSQLKWGESKDFLELARALTEQLHEQFGDKVACDQFLISRTFSSLLGNQHFALGKKRNVPMTLEQIKAIGTSAALYQLMLNEYQKPMGLSQSILSLLPSATMDQNSSDQKMKRLWCWFFAFKLGAHQDFLENILLGPNSAWSSFENELRDISLHWRKLLFSHEEIGFIFPHKLLQELKDKMKLGLALFPLPKVEKANAAWAHQLLGTNPQMSKEEIKKVFRTLALELHPDKMPAELLTPKLLTIANENFSMLKEASNWPFENGN